MNKLTRAVITLSPGLVLGVLCIAMLQSGLHPQPVVAQGTTNGRRPVYLSNRLIVTGVFSDLNRFRNDARFQQFEIRPIPSRPRANLSFFANVPTNIPQRLVFFTPAERPFVRTDVLELGNGDVDALLASPLFSTQYSRTLFARDYVLAKDWSVIADPRWTGGGSSYTVTANAPPALYRQQFSQLGFYGMHPLANNERPYPFTGQGTKIALFDTSPYSGVMSNNESALQVAYGATVSVTHFPLTPIPSATITSPLSIAGHGMFAAGLAHAIAPSATLYLFRVLDDNGIGTTDDMIAALTAFSDSIDSSTVLNFSLAVLIGNQDPEDIHPLYEMLNVYAAQGATIVAAAGNESDQPPILPLAFPASMNLVVGTASANVSGKRSCYSNSATYNTKKGIAAPGGDGDASGGGCQPPTAEVCENSIACLTSWWTPTQAPTFTYGVGTSFAAPFASGAAALAIDKYQREGDLIGPNTIANFLYLHARPGDAQLGHGTINLMDMFLPKRNYMPVVYR